ARSRNRTGTPLRAGDFKSEFLNNKINHLSKTFFRINPFQPPLRANKFVAVQKIAEQYSCCRGIRFQEKKTL
ncbi:hypothetical protein ACW9H6_29380, partial [Pseudomonas sp. SDO528_S397]